MSHDKFYARYAYEAMLLQQPHIQFEGLWQVGPVYCIHCPSLTNSPLTVDGKPLAAWFDKECRPMGSPVKLVEKLADGAIRVPERTLEEISLLHGEPLTGAEVSREITAALPPQFPLAAVEPGNGRMIVNVDRPLNEEEQIELDIAISNLKIEVPYDVRVSPAAAESIAQREASLQAPLGGGDLALRASRTLANTISTSLRHAYAEDEAFWMDNRLRLFAEAKLTKEQILPIDFQHGTSSCLIDATVFRPNNIRNYLPLYRRIIIAMPLADRLEIGLQGLGVTRAELLELVRRGRVQFALPQPLERYDVAFLTEVLAARKDALLFSRRLSMATVVEARSRAPFLYPTLGSLDRRKLIEIFESIDDPRFGPIARAIARSLGQEWVGMERIISQRGATGNLSYGIGSLLGQVIQRLTGRDVAIELAVSGASVEWAAALNATYFPFEDEKFSEVKAASLCASMYSGVRNAPLISPLKDFNIFVEGLLTLDNDAPVLEVEEVFTTRDVDRLGAYLKGLSPREDGASVLQALNEKVVKFERKQERLNRVDMFSLGGAVAGVFTTNVYLPLGGWVLQYVLSKADPSKDIGGRVIDWIRAANALTSPGVVLVSRMRRKLHGREA